MLALETTSEYLPESNIDSLFNLYPEIEYAYLFASNHFDEVELGYHNWEHTYFVTTTAIEIAKREGFNSEEITRTGVMALFHDFGYVVDDDEGRELVEFNHPQRSAEAFEEFAKKFQTLFPTTTEIEDGKMAIRNTDMKDTPPNRYAKVLRDADLAVLGNIDFGPLNQALRQECIDFEDWNFHNLSINQYVWLTSQLIFLEAHDWFTTSAREMFEPQKQKNILLLKALLEEI